MHYEDALDKFSLDVPSDWQNGEGQASASQGFTGAAGTRRAIAWYVDGNSDTNVTVVCTNTAVAPTPADYTNLGSFGDAEQFGNNMVAQMDRSFMNRSPWKPKQPVQEASLVEAKSRSGSYYIEYTVRKPDQDERHLFSVVSLGFNGRYNRMLTLTAQCKESELNQWEGKLQSILKTFKPPKVVV
eukprot:jgi/Astpho2/5497/Aster-07832